MSRRRTAVAAAGAVVAVAAAVLHWGGWLPGTQAPTAEESAGLVVMDQQPPELPGYDRSCKKGGGCVFGPAWTDDVNVAGGHNGCDQRNDVLRAELDDVELRPGSDCVVLSGVLTDPYTGERVEYVRGQDSPVLHIDHIFPLAQAWNRGAAEWSAEQRQDFAGDPLNLTPSEASVNRAKSDAMPGEWEPETATGRCFYATRFRDVAQRYQLAVTADEMTALGAMARDCSKKEYIKG